MIEKLRISPTSRICIIFIALGMASMPVAASPSRMMDITLCTADGKIRTVSIPLEQDGGGDPECAKPCHACVSRNKSAAKPAGH